MKKINAKLACSSETFVNGLWVVLKNNPSLVLIITVTFLSMPLIGPWSLLVMFVTVLVVYGPLRDRLEAAVERGWVAAGKPSAGVDTSVLTGRSDYPTRLSDT